MFETDTRSCASAARYLEESITQELKMNLKEKKIFFRPSVLPGISVLYLALRPKTFER